MKIQCKKCGHTEITNAGLFVKIIGGAAPVGGFWAWTAYIFAGTGFALPIPVPAYLRHAMAGIRGIAAMDRRSTGSYDDGDAVPRLCPLRSESDAPGRICVRSHAAAKRHRICSGKQHSGRQ